MDPTVVPDAQPAAPSAAVDVPYVEPSDRLAKMSEPERLEWRKTGEIPKTAPQDLTTPADSSPAAAAEDQPASTEAISEPASEAGTARPDPRATENRIPQLLDEKRRERERADRAEARLAEIDRQHQPPQTSSADSSPAPAGPAKPNPEQFPYGTADPGYLEALTEYKVAVTLANARSAWEGEQQRARETAEQQRIETDFRARIVESRAKHPDYDEVALTNVKIPPGTLAEFWVKETPAGAEILYHFQQPQNAAERERIVALPYKEQVIELVRLGDRLTGAAPAAPSTQAPPPPPALRTRATPGDPIERAVKTGDYAAYKRAADERDLAARRK